MNQLTTTPQSAQDKRLTQNAETHSAKRLAILERDADLAAVVRAWPGLPADVKRQIKELIETSGQ
ncbi:MAG TPA: hypothetical protein VMW24_28985 [Sedimentisphaerales bacterium]|nr:hypothetical protein [Sedimentisphaerales bacterium]